MGLYEGDSAVFAWNHKNSVLFSLLRDSAMAESWQSILLLESLCDSIKNICVNFKNSAVL